MANPADVEPIGDAQKLEIVREVRIRLPDVVVMDLKAQAHLERKTMNALIAGYIDIGLKAVGRPGVFRQARRFQNYLRRKGGRNSGASAVTDEDDGNFA